MRSMRTVINLFVGILTCFFAGGVAVAENHLAYICDVEQMAGFAFTDDSWQVATLDKRNQYMVRPLSARDRGADSDVRGLTETSTHAIQVLSDPVIPLVYACETAGTLIMCTGGKFMLSTKTMKFEYAHFGIAPFPDEVLASMQATPEPGLQWGRCKAR